MLDNNLTIKKYVKLIHTQARAAGFSDDARRDFLVDITGKDSCSDLDMLELRSVFDAFNLALKAQGRQPFVFITSKKTCQVAVAARAKAVLGPGYQARLDGFLKSIDKVSVYDCNASDIRRVMGFISTVERKKK